MKKKIIKLSVAIIGFVVFMCFTARTVSGTEQKSNALSPDVYESMETELLKEIKAVLTQNNYSNSGINMTKVIDTDENRIYTVSIYHARLTDADDGIKQDLLGQLEMLNGFGDYTPITYEIGL